MSAEGEPEWWFYHLERTSLEQALPPLLEKCLSRGWRVLVASDSPDRLKDLAAALWTYREESFLPHGADGGGQEADQPILLSSSLEAANQAKALALLDGTDAPVSAPFERVMVVFDDRDTPSKTAARGQFKRAREGGVIVRYFQQTDRGGWAEKG